jgi:Transposase DDE domain.
MLHDKSIKRIEEIQTDFHPNEISVEKILSGFKALKLTESFSEFNKMKSRGYSFKTVLSLLIWMVVLPEKTVSSSLKTLHDNGLQMGKDVFYRLKNRESICWRRILWYIAEKFIKLAEENNTSEEDKPRYLIFDDTTVEKSGKKMECLGRVWDHVKQRSVLGFKILVAMYWDGKSSVPIDFSIHNEKGKKESRPYGMSKSDKRKQYSKKRIKESEGSNRMKELDTSKIEMMLRMLYSAIYRCLPIDYVLVDSWFTCDALIKTVRSEGLHLIGMYKIAKTKFIYHGVALTYSEINKRISKSKRCCSFNLYYKRADVIYDGEWLTLFFTRQGKRGKWKVILTTDTELSFIKTIEHYQVRWTVEVFNKEAKGLLNLGGCQSSNFDARVADATISMIAYILLSFRYRYDHYESMGSLYRSMNAEWLRMTLDKRLWELFLEIVSIVAAVFDIDCDDLLEKILTNSDAEKLMAVFLDSKQNIAC